MRASTSRCKTPPSPRGTGALVVDANTGAITLEDTGSTNGTYVNEEHLGFNGRRELRDGDKIRFGGFTTIVKVIGRI